MDPVSVAYDAAPWHELYVMTGGAAGALAGLLFVAVSINLDRIIGGQGLPRRAAETLVFMVACSPFPCWCSHPDAGRPGVRKPRRRPRRDRRHGEPTPAQRGTVRAPVPALILGAFGVPVVAGAVSLVIGAGGGLYWFVPAVVLGFAGAVLNAWVLLVEIIR